jgi:hypothetical protein
MQTKPSRMPVLMSALAYPGVGQFMQKRIFWGLVYSVGFTLFFVITCVLLVRGILSAFTSGTPMGDVLHSLVKPVALSAALWLANIYDAWWADHKAHRAMVARAGVPPPL